MQDQFFAKGQRKKPMFTESITDFNLFLCLYHIFVLFPIEFVFHDTEL